MLYLANTLYYIWIVAVYALAFRAVATVMITFKITVWSMTAWAQFLILMITTLFVNEIHVSLLLPGLSYANLLVDWDQN